MDWVQAVVLAIVQGLTEFLPISSSAHLILPSKILGWPDQGVAFDVAVHLGTLSAVIFYFRKTLWQLLLGASQAVSEKSWNQDMNLISAVIIGTIPAGLAGLMLKGFIETSLRTTMIIALSTIGFGVVLGLADRWGKKNKQQDQISIFAGLWVGLAQMLALIPGTSRSGITITAALALGYDRVTAAHFSFLLSIPLILAGGSLGMLDLMHEQGAINIQTTLFATVLSALVAFITIHGFVKFLDRVGMMPFVIYRILLGGILLLYFV